MAEPEQDIPDNTASFVLTSTDIAEGESLGNKHELNVFGGNGDNLSPQLTWAGAPEGTKSFVLTCFDPDAPTGSGWWHWVAFNIPDDVSSLDTGVGTETSMPVGTIQARNDFGEKNFGGACPPPGEVHRYEFRVHALNIEALDLDEDATPALVGFMTHVHTIATAKLTAVYTR